MLFVPIRFTSTLLANARISLRFWPRIQRRMGDKTKNSVNLRAHGEQRAE